MRSRQAPQAPSTARTAQGTREVLRPEVAFVIARISVKLVVPCARGLEPRCVLDHVVGPPAAAPPDSKRAARCSSFSTVSGFSRWASYPALHVRV